MSDPAIISAQLVDIRNIAAHKCVRLEIHVPVEQAAEVMRCFGWPTAVDPVPVAIARFDASKASQRPAQSQSETKERQPFGTMPYAKQAAIKCQDRDFQRFLGVTNSDQAADAIRLRCQVKSRADIETSEPAKKAWLRTLAEYDEWQGAR